MTEPFMGQIIQGGWNFAPRGYAMCSGQTLPIAQNTALFSLLGTVFGGNGQTTFGLPDLRGRTMVGQGQAPGLQNYPLGVVIGTENATLTVQNMPAHSHTGQVSGNGSATFSVQNIRATANTPTAGGSIARSVDLDNTAAPAIYVPAGTTPATPVAIAGMNLAGATVTTAVVGGSQPFSILQPLLGITMVIALQGIFPTRN